MFQFLSRDYLFSWKWGWRNWNLDPPPSSSKLEQVVSDSLSELEHQIEDQVADSRQTFWATYSNFRRGKEKVSGAD
jgi:hypothetical protein